MLPNLDIALDSTLMDPESSSRLNTRYRNRSMTNQTTKQDVEMVPLVVSIPFLIGLLIPIYTFDTVTGGLVLGGLMGLSAYLGSQYQHQILDLIQMIRE